MNRNLPTYADAVQRVKIGMFAEQYKLDITGVIHVGTNYGYEIKWYLAMGIKYVVGFEPLESAFEQAREIYPPGHVSLYPYALGQRKGLHTLHVVAGDGQGSSLLQERVPDLNHIALNPEFVQVVRYDSIDWLYSKYCDCLVIDVEGYEMNVLIGFGSKLDSINMICVELSEEPLFVGQSPASEVVDFLAKRGFHQITPIERHNDVLFIRMSY